MDELVGPSLIQGDQLDIPDENEADTLNDETFGDFEEGSKYTWDEDQGRGKLPVPTEKAESRSDVSKIQEEYSQMTLESLWKKPDLGDRALVQGDDILSSSPFSQGPPRPPHGHMMQHQRMRYHSDKDGGYSSPPHHHHHGNPSPRPWTWDGFMNERERERFKDIHLSQLQCDDPFNEDYYYQKFLLKSRNTSANVSESTPQSEEAHKRLVIPDVKKEEKGTYTPMEFAGALGKLTKSSVNTPRQVLMVVRSEGELVEKEIEKELNSQQKRRKLFMAIEKMYSLMLEVEEIDHKMPNLSDEEKFTSSQRRETLLEQLFRLTGAKTPGETWKKSDDMFFLQLMFIRKGKLLMGRLLSLFDQAKCRCVFGALMRNMTAVIRRDKTDCVLRVLLKPLLSVVSTMRLSEVLSNVTALAKGPPQANPPRSALVMAGSCSFGANLLIGLIGRGNSASLEDDTPTDERKEWEDFHSEIKEKLAEFQMELDTVLRAHNGPTLDNTSVE